MTKAICDLVPGDKVNLEADEYADPECYICNWEECKHPEFHFEYEIVGYAEQETDDCICVYFESGFSCGFPLDHKVYVEADAVDA